MPNYDCMLQCKNIAYQVQNIDGKSKYLLETMQQKNRKVPGSKPKFPRPNQLVANSKQLFIDKLTDKMIENQTLTGN